MKFVDMGGTYAEQRERDMSGVLSMAALERHDARLFREPESTRA